MTATTPGPMETSCGFILLNYDSILLLPDPQGHWSVPKGHVERTDLSRHETAARELKEETGIEKVEIDNYWESRTEYTFRKKGRSTSKQVYWYIAMTDEVDVKLSEEHTSYLWLNHDDAESMLTFEQEKKLLRSAIIHMKKSGMIP